MASCNSSKLLVALMSAFTGLALANSVQAQVLDNAPEPEVRATDEAGVDLRSGKLIADMGNLTIGPVANPVFSYSILAATDGTDTTVTDGVSYENCYVYSGIPGCTYYGYSYRLNGQTDAYMIRPRYSTSPPGFTEKGAMLINDNTLIMKDGSVWEFGNGGLTIQSGDPSLNPYGLKGFVTKITKPDGETLTYSYNSGELISITSSLGYLLHLEGNKSPYYRNGNVTTMQSGRPDKVVLINLAIDYCSPVASVCSGLTRNWPSMRYSGWSGNNTISATDNLGRIRKRVLTGTGQFKLIWPSGSWLEYNLENWQDTFSSVGGAILCDPRSATKWVKNAQGQWNYAFVKNHQCRGGRSVISNVSTGPGGRTQSWNNGFIDGLSRKTTYVISQYSNFFGSGETGVEKITLPDESHYDYVRDDRLNVTSITLTPSSGSGSLVAQATYPATCTATTAKYCNKPTYTVDANGKRTDFTYSPQHGGILVKTLPAGADGIRPQIRYTYQQLYAHYKNASGTVVASPSPVWRLISTSSCTKLATCTGTSDEVIEQFTYDSSLQPITETKKLGDGTVLSTVATAYDAVGNVISINGPAAGADDTTYYFYDDYRESIGEIGPDPDGAGALQRPAKRRTYNADGKLVLEETGTVSGTTKASLAAMTVQQFMRNTYDPATGRLVRSEVGAP